MIYALYVFDRHCRCIYHVDYLQPATTALTTAPAGTGAPAGAAAAAASSAATTTASTTIATTTSSNSPQDVPSTISWEETAKLVYGVCFSLRNLVGKLTPSVKTESLQGDCGFHSYATNTYRMHYMQTQSNLRFIAITSLSAAPSSIRTLLHRIYADAYVEYVTRNPLVASAEAGGARLLRGNEMFRRKVDELVRGVAVVAG